MNRHRLIKGLVIAIAIVAIVGVTQATFSIVVDPGLKFLGQWSWNTATSSTVKTRVQNVTNSTVVVLVDIKARADDGSTVGASTRVQLLPQAGKEVTQVLGKPITSLQFIQLRLQPTNANGHPPCSCPGGGGGEDD